MGNNESSSNQLKQRELEIRHKEEMEKILNLEKGNERKDTQLKEDTANAHQRQLQVLSIIEGIFQKVTPNNAQEAAYAAIMLYSMQFGETMDKDVLTIVAKKIPDPAPTEFTQRVQDAINETCIEEEATGTDSASLAFSIIASQEGNRNEKTLNSK